MKPSDSRYVRNLPASRRVSPRNVPIHRTPLRSSNNEITRSCDKPSRVVNFVRCPSADLISPEPAANQKAPERSSRIAAIQSFKSGESPAYRLYLPRSMKPTALLVPTHTRPALSS